jgi:hypothetical protein
VCTLLTGRDAIGGTHFFRIVKAEIDLEAQKLWMLKSEENNHDSLEMRPSKVRGTADRATLTVFSASDSRGRQNSCWIDCRTRE